MAVPKILASAGPDYVQYEKWTRELMKGRKGKRPQRVLRPLPCAELLF
jgi:hypothetical protein